MASRTKVPGDGKLREETAIAGEEVEKAAEALASAHESPPGSIGPFVKGFKASLQKYANLMGDKARRGQKIVTSQGQIDLWDRVSARVHGLLPSPHRELTAEMDYYDGDIARLLRGCRRNMVAANKTQRGKSSTLRASEPPRPEPDSPQGMESV